MNPPGAKSGLPQSTTDANSTSPVGPDVPRVVSSDVFISRAVGPLTPEERRQRIEAVLKFMGLPPLDEFNRIDAEAYAAANKDPTEPRG
jgi:hypothetical protein